MNRVLVIGATGLIGYCIFKKYSNSKDNNVIGTYFSHEYNDFKYLDIKDKSNIEIIFSDFKPNIVFCPASVPNVEFCEEYPDISRETNVIAIKTIIDYCKMHDSKLIYFSTEYIFDGKSGPYLEVDQPNPINEYGKQKVEVEDYIINNINDYLIVRTTVVFGWEIAGKNFVISLIKKLNFGDKVKVPIDQISSPTYVNNLIDILNCLISKNRIGIYNIAGSETMSRYKFALKICTVFDLNMANLIPVETKMLNQKASRPLNAGLKIDKIISICDIKPLSPINGLKNMFNSYYG